MRSWPPFGLAQDRPFGLAQDRPFGLAQDRPFDIPAVRPELVEGDGWLAQDRLGAMRRRSDIKMTLAKTQRAPRKENKKLEARNPKYETNSNDIISNFQN